MTCSFLGELSRNMIPGYMQPCRRSRVPEYLNKDKCEFSKNRLVFLGHVIDNTGVSPDPQKTSAIVVMEKSTTRTQLRRFMGMVN